MNIKLVFINSLLAKFCLDKHFCPTPVMYSSGKKKSFSTYLKLEFLYCAIVLYCAIESAENYAKGVYAKGSLKA